MKTLSLLRLLLGFALPVAPALAAEPATVVIDSLAALAENAARSHARIKMKPGVYLLNDATMLRSAEIKHPEAPGKVAGQYSVNSLLHFTGNDSSYDLTDVTIEIDTRLHQAARGALDKILVSGHRTTITGLTVNDLGDTPPHKGGLRMLHVIGDGNTLKNMTLRTRGSAPYGYGNLLGKGGHALVPLYKQSCLLITGRDNRILGAKVIARTFGHGIVMQGAVNTLIQDCYVEGEMRSTDDMLKETSGPAHSVSFQSDYPPGRIVPGLMVALSEDGVRAYPNGSQVGGRRTENITVVNCTVKNMRSGFDLVAARGAVRVTGSTAIGSSEKGYSVPSGGVIERCAGDALYAPLLSLHDKNGRDCRIDLTLLGTSGNFPPARLAEINGTGHRIVIKADPAGEPSHARPIVFGDSFWADVQRFRDPTITREDSTGARGIELRNETAMPLVLGKTARDCVITTRGKVLRDDGENNRFSAMSPPAPASKSPAKVVCFGDSITKRGYPDELGKRLGVATINAGVGGNTTTAGLKRMQREVLDLKPRVVVIFFGTNDSRVDAPKIHVPVDHYVANLRQMITRCAAIQARVVLCTVPPINPEPYFQRHAQAVFDEAGGLSKILDGYRAAVRRLGTELDLPVVDLAQQLASEPAWLSADGVHPTPAGNAILAKLIAEKVSPLLGSRPAPHANP